MEIPHHISAGELTQHFGSSQLLYDWNGFPFPVFLHSVFYCCTKVLFVRNLFNKNETFTIPGFRGKDYQLKHRLWTGPVGGTEDRNKKRYWNWNGKGVCHIENVQLRRKIWILWKAIIWGKLRRKMDNKNIFLFFIKMTFIQFAVDFSIIYFTNWFQRNHRCLRMFSNGTIRDRIIKCIC